MTHQAGAYPGFCRATKSISTPPLMECWSIVGSVGLCRHNFEHNKYYIWSIRYNAGIILIVLQHNANILGT